jgi:exosortase/archaeosortase
MIIRHQVTNFINVPLIDSINEFQSDFCIHSFVVEWFGRDKLCITVRQYEQKALVAPTTGS